MYNVIADSSFGEHHPKLYEFVRKACTKVMKILVAIQTRHPYSFGDQCVLPLVMDFCLNKITDPEPEIMSFDKFLIECMSMVKIVLECKEYKPIMTGRVIDENVITLEQRKKNISGAVAGVLTSLLPNDRVVLLCNVLIRRYAKITLLSFHLLQSSLSAVIYKDGNFNPFSYERVNLGYYSLTFQIKRIS